jgi:mono/diheme cytochrome c family protein
MEWIYQLLGSLGYHHPLHPPLVHPVIGMVMGAFVFQLLATIRNNPQLATTARHCATLALCALIPAAAAGLMDWQHNLAGAWLFPIKIKLCLAGALLVALGSCFAVQRRAQVGSWLGIVCYGLPLLIVVALGYFGGELVYAKPAKGAQAATADVQAGERLFLQHCSACHPSGENVLKPALAPRRAPQLADERTFLSYLRHPHARDGTDTVMPAFPVDKLADSEAGQIRRYILDVLRQQPGGTPG